MCLWVWKTSENKYFFFLHGPVVSDAKGLKGAAVASVDAFHEVVSPHESDIRGDAQLTWPICSVTLLAAEKWASSA